MDINMHIPPSLNAAGRTFLSQSENHPQLRYVRWRWSSCLEGFCSAPVVWAQSCQKQRYNNMREVVHVSTCLYVRVTQRKESFFSLRWKCASIPFQVGGSHREQVKQDQESTTPCYDVRLDVCHQHLWLMCVLILLTICLKDTAWYRRFLH